MNSLVSCLCGHTLEHHLTAEGCDRCACRQSRTDALEALIDALRAETPEEKPSTFRTTGSGNRLRMVP